MRDEYYMDCVNQAKQDSIAEKVLGWSIIVLCLVAPPIVVEIMDAPPNHPVHLTEKECG